MTFLSKVEEVFEIKGRGCILLPGLLESLAKDKNLLMRRGDSIELRKPDGSIIQTQLAEIDALRGERGIFFPIVLPKQFSKTDVPIGTEVWLCGTDSN
jgi:hypothetical protein